MIRQEDAGKNEVRREEKIRGKIRKLKRKVETGKNRVRGLLLCWFQVTKK